MDRNEALHLLADERFVVAPGQTFSIDLLNPDDPADATGVARLFYAIYGDDYPVNTVYIPERLIAENRAGTLCSAVARTASGDIVAHTGLYRSSPPNVRLYELGLSVTLPAYRNGKAFWRTMQRAAACAGSGEIDGYYGEAVCNHVITQRASALIGGVETALEPALMPARVPPGEGHVAGRIGCLFSTRIARDEHRQTFVPAAYTDEFDFLFAGLGLERSFSLADAALSGERARLDVTRFAAAGVARCSVGVAGRELGERLDELLATLENDGYALVQFFVNLGAAHCGAVVDTLRGRGFSLGGVLPVWFGSDGLLMQKHWVDPGFDGLMIHSERARRIVNLVRRDHERNA